MTHMVVDYFYSIPDVFVFVQNLKSFFEKRASDIKKQAALTQTIKKAVSAKKLYKKHSKRVSIEQNMVSISGVAATLMAGKWRKKTGSSTT